MRPVLGPATGAVLCLSALVAATQDRRTDPPIFQSGVELIQLDVSVLDGGRRPVLGLAPGDFTVLVDGQPRPIAAFKPVELPSPPPPPAAPWLRDVAPDVVTNSRPAGRVVAIVIDDGSFGVMGVADLFAVRKTREVARAAVDQLGPEDLAGVFFTENGHTAQNFTTDRQRLFMAIDNAALLPSPPTSLGDPFGHRRPACPCGTCSIEAIARVADGLRALPQQRKIIVFASAGVRVEAAVSTPYNPIGQGEIFEDAHCNARKQRVMADAIRQASLANVTVQSVDVRGLLAADRSGDASGPIDTRIGFLQAMAEDTGGRAVVRNNDMEREVAALIEESSSYYLLGVDSTGVPDDGRLHAVEVRVNRPNTEVRTRRGFFALTPAERNLRLAAAATDVDTAVAGALPKTDVPLDIAVMPLADPTDRRGATLAVVIGVTHENHGPGVAQSETVRIRTTAFNPETGASVGSEHHTLSIGRLATERDRQRYEVLSRLPVAPGRYEVRAAVETGDGHTGSIYTYAEVPDFRRSDLSISGLLLTTIPAIRHAPPDTFRGLLSEVPTARRTFTATDQVQAILRIYQRDVALDTTVTTRLTDARNEVLAEMTEPVLEYSDGEPHAADHRIELPVPDLAAGEYLLTVEVRTLTRAERRHVRFRVESREGVSTIRE